MARWFSFMRGNILVMTVCECVWRSTIDIIWPFLAIYVLELGGSYETIGLIMAVGSLSSLFLYPLGGYIADYQGRIKLIAYMTFAYGTSFLVPAFTETWQMLTVGIFIQNLVTFYFPARQALIADSIPPEQRGIGFAATTAIPSAFGITAPFVGGWLIETLGIRRAMRGLYFSGFFIAAAIALFRLKFLKETVENPRRLDLSLSRLPRLLYDSYRSVFSVLGVVSRQLWTLSLLTSTCVFFASLASSFWIVRASEIIGLSVQQWGTVMLFSGLVSVVFGIPAGGVADRLPKRWIAGVGLILGAVQSLLYLYSANFTHVMLLACFSSLTNSFMNPAFQSLFADMTPREQRGRVLASIGGGGVWLMRGAYGSGVLGRAMQTVGSLVSGYVYSYDSSLPWVVMSGALLILGCMLIALVREPERAEI